MKFAEARARVQSFLRREDGWRGAPAAIPNASELEAIRAVAELGGLERELGAAAKIGVVARDWDELSRREQIQSALAHQPPRRQAEVIELADALRILGLDLPSASEDEGSQRPAR